MFSEICIFGIVVCKLFVIISIVGRYKFMVRGVIVIIFVSNGNKMCLFKIFGEGIGYLLIES